MAHPTSFHANHFCLEAKVMIVLEKLDVRAREATLRCGLALAETPGAVDRARDWLEQLGIDSIAVTTPEGSQPLGPRVGNAAVDGVWNRAAQPAGAAVAATPFEHRCDLAAGVTTYTARFQHRWESLETISAYLNALLATYEPQGSELQQLHLALYELCANALEHGRPRRAQATIELEMRFESEAISGWIRDDCQPFDPTAHPLRPLQEHLGKHRARGYGIHIIRRCLGALVHRTKPEGNQIEFRMETHT